MTPHLAAIAGAVLAARLLGLSPAAAAPATPSLAEVERAEDALADLWSRAPYGARRIVFVSRKAAIYGDWEKRPTSVFAPGETLVTYLEPVGYRWTWLGSGRYGFGVTTDFEVATRSGEVLAARKAFHKAELTSRYRNREFFVTLTMSIDGIEPGDYVLAYTLHDLASDKTARVEQPFSVAAK